MTDWGRFPVAAQRGREMMAEIRDTLFALRMRGIPVREVWVSDYASRYLQAMWDFIAALRKDLILPKRIERVPFRVGMTGGDDYVIVRGEPGDPLTPYIEGLSPVSDRPAPRPGSLRHAIANAIGTEAASKLTH